MQETTRDNKRQLILDEYISREKKKYDSASFAVKYRVTHF